VEWPGGIAVPDDFALAPGAWTWNGTAWVSYTPPPTKARQDFDDLLAYLTAVGRDGSQSESLRTLAEKLRIVLADQLAVRVALDGR
jgi:hypothetical protein